MKFKFELYKEDSGSKARAGEFFTPHGSVKTPVFMAVGTLATVKSLSAEDLKATSSQIVLGNTYHLLLRPGPEVFQKFGGIHNFMKWDRPVLTDSGGFQIFSLPKERKMTEEGAVFQSYVDGGFHELSPEKSMAMQNDIGSDIMMVLDQCIASTADLSATRAAMELTHRWALRSLNAHGKITAKNSDSGRPYQAAFAIVQGGVFHDLRRESAAALTQHDFDGFAIGGLAVGESKSEREDMTELVAGLLPRAKPRYLMGVGTPADLLEAVRRGVDMFDCIIPTKMSQQGNVYTSRGLVKLPQAQYKFSEDPIDADCDCSVCKTHARGYLHHLSKCREALGWTLLSIHNVHFYNRLMEQARLAIMENRYTQFYQSKIAAWAEGESEVVSGREEAEFPRVRKSHKGRLAEKI